MPRRRLLLFSNSVNPGQGYLDHALPVVAGFLGDAVAEVLFVPYAAVSVSYDAYAARVRERFETLGLRVASLHEAPDPVAAVARAEAVVVGGGNTFHLVRGLYDAGVMAPLAARAAEGLPYIGWSAGANVACPTLRTTNDMPVVEPPSFRTLGLVPFQINPHYTNAMPEGHQGETRDQRLAEFVAANPGVPVVGLPEGDWLHLERGVLRLAGARPARLFGLPEADADVASGADLSFLLHAPTV